MVTVLPKKIPIAINSPHPDFVVYVTSIAEPFLCNHKQRVKDSRSSSIALSIVMFPNSALGSRTSKLFCSVNYVANAIKAKTTKNKLITFKCHRFIFMLYITSVNECTL